jgi:hypothetical protein
MALTATATPLPEEPACERRSVASPPRRSIWFELLVVVFLFVGVLMLFAWTSHRRALARNSTRHAVPQPLAAQASPGASEDVSLDEAGDGLPVGSQASAAG